jgi:hypothetical protein
MAMRRTTIGTVLALAVISLVVSALGALVATRTVSNTGTLRILTPPPSVQLGIYSDSGCTTVLSSIPWGTLDPGSTVTSTIYVKNEGNVPLTLTAQASNWNPASAQSFFTFTWNRGGYVLAVGASVQAVLNLTVSSSITGITTFSFDITITATQ